MAPVAVLSHGGDWAGCRRMSRPGSDVQSLDTPLDPELLRAVPLQVLLIPKGKDPVYFFFSRILKMDK